MDNKKNKLLVHFFGLKRNGNHAIINWVQEHAKLAYKRVSFINDINESRLSYNDLEDAIADNDFIIFSYEEIDVKDIDRVIHKTRKKVRQQTILVLRDIGNSLASRMQYIVNFKSATINVYDYFLKSDEYISTWSHYAEEYVNKSSKKYLCFSYNDWFLSKHYRDETLKLIMDKLNTDAGITTVMRHGGGSSFEHLNYDGRATQMNVFERWKLFADDPTFKNLILSNKSLLNLNEEIFKIRYE